MLTLNDVQNKEHKIIVANESRAELEKVFHKNFYLIVTQGGTIMYQVEAETKYTKKGKGSSMLNTQFSAAYDDVQEAIDAYNVLSA